MNKTEIFDFINANPVFALASAQGSQPRVRYMMTAFADDDHGIIFCTGKQKDIYKQLSANPAIELCFYSTESEKQVRVSATADELDDLELKKSVVEKFEFLKPWIEQAGYGDMAVYKLANAKATAWTMQTNTEHKTYTDL